VTCCGWCLLCQAVHSTWCPSRWCVTQLSCTLPS
jgi:hypothetical protein